MAYGIKRKREKRKRKEKKKEINNQTNKERKNEQAPVNHQKKEILYFGKISSLWLSGCVWWCLWFVVCGLCSLIKPWHAALKDINELDITKDRWV